MSNQHPTYRQLREFLVEDNGWTAAEFDTFEATVGEHLDGFGHTKLTYDQWEVLVCQYNDEAC